MRRCKSDAYEAIYEETLLQYEAGLISEAEMREYAEDCLVQEPEESYAAEPSSPVTLSLGS
jgi:DNA-binding transcriptional regulator YiaG